MRRPSDPQAEKRRATNAKDGVEAEAHRRHASGACALAVARLVLIHAVGLLLPLALNPLAHILGYK